MARKILRRRAGIAESLAACGMDRGFALAVEKTFDERGAGDALVQLYAGGWQPVVEWENGEKRLVVRRILSMKGKDDGEEKTDTKD